MLFASPVSTAADHVAHLLLFSLFFAKVRAQDGLLQRYLKKTSGRATTRQGEMLSYWYQGNNYTFLLLLSHIAQSALCRSIVKDRSSDEDDAQAAEEFLLPAISYYESFADMTEDVWERVVSPFRKASKDEIQDFLDDDEEDEPDYSASHRALHAQSEMAEFEREQHADEQRAAYFDSMGKDHDEDSSDSDEVEEVDASGQGCYEESSEEEQDEWEQGIKSKRVARSRFQSPKKRNSRRVSMSSTKQTTPQKRAAAKSPASSSDDEVFVPAPSSLVRKRLVIQDSDEESE